MSSTELGKQSAIYSYDMPALTGGAGVTTTALATGVPNLDGTSRLLSIVRKTAGGVVGTPHAWIVQPTAQAVGATGYRQLSCVSNTVADTSVYTVYWENNYTPSSVYLQTTPALPASQTGVQFRP